MKKFRNEAGFTLIELVVIIVILGIMAVIAVPKYLDIRAEAEQGVATGVTGALRGSIAILHARYLMGGSDYGISNVVSGVEQDGLTSLSGTGTTITATFASGNTYTWTYTARSGNTAGTVAKDW